MAPTHSSLSLQNQSPDREESSTFRRSPPSSFEAPISPPPFRAIKRRKTRKEISQSSPSLAAIEAGKACTDDHLNVFSNQLSQRTRPSIGGQRSTLSIDEFKDLYQRNQHAHGRHFVVQQQDHPIAGWFTSIFLETLAFRGFLLVFVRYVLCVSVSFHHRR